jgi:hypothetical protein
LANDSNQKSYDTKDGQSRGVSKVVGVGLISAASAIAGGLAMAWWYRKTLSKFQNPILKDEVEPSVSHKLDTKPE